MNIPRLIIAGTQSGVGKTTLVTGLLKAWSKSGLRVQPFKVGPDYIDPGFHRLASGRASHNLDSWLVPPEELVRQFADYSKDCDLAVIEGVMGLYDGGRRGISSTAEIAKLLQAPVVLVLDVKSMGESAAALALGYKLYDEQVSVAGVILNRLGSDSHERMIRQALEKLKIPVFGAVRRNNELVLQERHLGLTPVTELALNEQIQQMGDMAEQQLELDELRQVAEGCRKLPIKPRAVCSPKWDVHIGVAQDEVFSFYYADSLKVLQELGAKLIPFSPVHDSSLPPVHGLILGGGFPEMFVQALSCNEAMKKAIREAHRQAMPILAECGGFMYLCHTIQDFAGNSYEMAGLIPGRCEMQKTLQTVGYVEAKALKSNPLCQAGQTLRGHEFHFSRFIPEEEQQDWAAFEFTKLRTQQKYWGGYSQGNLIASYLHLHFAGYRQEAERFIEFCNAYKNR